MPQNITDVDTFTDPIVIPADADPADLTYIETLAQGLANRTRNLSRRHTYGGIRFATDEALAVATIGMTVTGWDSDMPDSSDFVPAANVLTAPYAGDYMARADLTVSGDDGVTFTFQFSLNGTVIAEIGGGVTLETGRRHSVSLHTILTAGVGGLVRLFVSHDSGAPADITIHTGSSFSLSRLG